MLCKANPITLQFYQSNTVSFSYKDIIEHVSSQTSIDKIYHADSYKDFILNVITTIVHNEDLILVDYRNSPPQQASEKISVRPIKFDSFEELRDVILGSKSNIGIYSSGTTAEPKLIYQKVQRLLKSVRISEDYKNTRWGFTYNPSHSAGIQVFLQAICNQATLYDLYKCSREDIVDTLKNEKITHLSATPTFYRMLAPYNFILTDLKSVTFNGEKSTIDLINAIKSVSPNARIRNIYGSTESGPLMSSETTTFQVPQRIIDSIKIENNELFLKAHLVSKSVNDSAWYPTGDLVNVVKNEPLTIEFDTRKTSIINVGGQNVNPQEVEEVLISHPCIKDARVYGRPNKMIGNLIVAEVQILDKQIVKEKECINWCKEHLAAYKVPRMIHLVEKIEIGRTGKKL